jgi:hypothetical protein
MARSDRTDVSSRAAAQARGATPHPKTVAVDFDGVIHAYSRGWADGSIYDDPIPGALDAIRNLMAAGVAVFVHTTRNPQHVAGWLRVRDIPALSLREMAADGEEVGEFWNRTDLVLVSNRKLPAVAYIDDRGIRFEDWEQALLDLAVIEQIEVPSTVGMSGDLDVCWPVEVDGETIRVRGEQPVNAEVQAALTDVVRAAKRRHEAEKAAERAVIERQVLDRKAAGLETYLTGNNPDWDRAIEQAIRDLRASSEPPPSKSRGGDDG